MNKVICVVFNSQKILAEKRSFKEGLFNKNIWKLKENFF